MQVTYLKINHIPKSIQVCTCCFFFTSFKFTIINQSFKLFEPFSYEQPCLTNCGANQVFSWQQQEKKYRISWINKCLRSLEFVVPSIANLQFNSDWIPIHWITLRLLFSKKLLSQVKDKHFWNHLYFPR